MLRALANCDAALKILPVRGSWRPDATSTPGISPQHLEAFLRALEPLIKEPDADSDTGAQAATAAMALLRASNDAVTGDPRFNGVQVFRGREPRTERVLALSIRERDERSRRGLLFSASPKANELLPLLVAAVPDAKLVLIDDRKVVDYLKEAREQDGSGPQPVPANTDSVLAVVKLTSRFGEESSRAGLLQRLNPGVDNDREALRRLCAGDPDAGKENAELRVLNRTTKNIERIVCELFGRRSNQFLVPSCIAHGLSGHLRGHLGIDVLDEPRLADLLGNDLDTISRIKPTPAEREAFLLIDLPHSLL